MGQQFVRHFGFFGIAQFGVVLLLAVEAVGGAALFGKGFVDEAAVGGNVQQSDVAVVVQELWILAGMGKDEVLDDKFDVDHAAARVFDVAVGRRMGGEHFFAHFDDFACQGGLVAFGGEDFGADTVEGRLNFGCAADEAGAGEGLVFPCPGVFALIFFEGSDAVGEEAGVAVGAQAQVGFVEAACAGGGGKPVGQAAGEAAVHVACVGVGVVVEVDEVEVGGVAEFFAAEFAVTDDGELRGVAVFFRHIRPRARQGGGEYGVGEGGELVGEGFYRPQSGEVLDGEAEDLGVLEAAQGVHLRFGVAAAGFEVV